MIKFKLEKDINYKKGVQRTPFLFNPGWASTLLVITS